MKNTRVNYGKYRLIIKMCRMWTFFTPNSCTSPSRCSSAICQNKSQVKNKNSFVFKSFCKCLLFIHVNHIIINCFLSQLRNTQKGEHTISIKSHLLPHTDVVLYFRFEKIVTIFFFSWLPVWFFFCLKNQLFAHPSIKIVINLVWSMMRLSGF